MKFKTMTTTSALALMLVAGFVALTVTLSTGVPSVSASSERNGQFHATKECSEYTFLPGGFCTFTSPNLAGRKMSSRMRQSASEICESPS